jgi:predicted outer membrane repeat protein
VLYLRNSQKSISNATKRLKNQSDIKPPQMKKQILALIIFLIPVILYGQLSGTGTYSDPYSGVFEGDQQWNLTNFPGGKVFIGGDVTVDNELLNIGAGMTVVFVTTGADLIINGTGSLSAIGSVGNIITFTADHDNDSNYGESGERWGHIVFNDPSESNQSLFEYCILEYGDVRLGSNTTSYGGALYVNSYNNLIITDCTFRHNRSTHGGGIMLWNGSTIDIINCLITNNTASSSGGGLYSQARSGLTVLNSIIAQNSAGGGGGGGIFLDGSDNSRFINCTVVMNISASELRGSNAHFYSVISSTIRPVFVNSILWSSVNSIDYSSGSLRTATDFNNCAIQDVATPASLFTNCIDVVADNDDPSGPNFIATDGTNWSIKYISPCRDAGLDSYPGVTIPVTDYIGNQRIGDTDIGAYEVSVQPLAYRCRVDRLGYPF